MSTKNITKTTTKKAAEYKFAALDKCRPAGHLTTARTALRKLETELKAAAGKDSLDLSRELTLIANIAGKCESLAKGDLQKRLDAAKRRRIRDLTKEEREAKKAARTAAAQKRTQDQLVKAVKKLKDSGLTKDQIAALLK